MADDFVKRGKWAGNWRRCEKMNKGEKCTAKNHPRHQKHWTGWYYPVGGQDGFGAYVMNSKKRQAELKRQLDKGRKKKWWQ